MEKIIRTQTPDWLAEKWEEWGKQWDDKYAQSKNCKDFKWRRNKKKGREHLVEALAALTQYHCSFCDAHPMICRVKDTIEHFRPKTKFPLEAYRWENLFLCCCNCQEKGEDFDDRLLKPDELDYDFDKYFDIDFFTGKLKENQNASVEDQERARITIKLYRLNEHGKPKDRLNELKKFVEIKEGSDVKDINEWSYRFLLKKALL